MDVKLVYLQDEEENKGEKLGFYMKEFPFVQDEETEK